MLESGSPVLLDGAMGTELIRRGVDVSLPLWSAAVLETDPECVLGIHREYVAAGARVLTANTFRTTTRTFLNVTGDPGKAALRARGATLKAVEVAKEAAGEAVFVAGSIAPLEDCYSPELFPGSEAAYEEFLQQGRWLVEGGVDLLLLETMVRLDEAEEALKATRTLRCPRWISFVVRDESHLLGGDDLAQAVRASEKLGATAVLINCSNLETTLRAAETLLSSSGGLAAGIYPNLGRSMPSKEGNIEAVTSMAEFLRGIHRAIDLGITIVGSCCGSRPEHTRNLRRVIDSL
ncbi:MAG: homocysteine S-methyltransferase family protein [Fidelibacterota bacterium]